MFEQKPYPHFTVGSTEVNVGRKFGHTNGFEYGRLAATPKGSLYVLPADHDERQSDARALVFIEQDLQEEQRTFELQVVSHETATCKKCFRSMRCYAARFIGNNCVHCGEDIELGSNSHWEAFRRGGMVKAAIEHASIIAQEVVVNTETSRRKWQALVVLPTDSFVGVVPQSHGGIAQGDPLFIEYNAGGEMSIGRFNQMFHVQDVEPANGFDENHLIIF